MRISPIRAVLTRRSSSAPEMSSPAPASIAATDALPSALGTTEEMPAALLGSPAAPSSLRPSVDGADEPIEIPRRRLPLPSPRAIAISLLAALLGAGLGIATNAQRAASEPAAPVAETVHAAEAAGPQRASGAPGASALRPRSPETRSPGDVHARAARRAGSGDAAEGLRSAPAK